MNKPQNNDLTGKRPPNAVYTGPPQKFQRQCHIATGDMEPTPEGVEAEIAYPTSSDEQVDFAAVTQEEATELIGQYGEDNEQEYMPVSVVASDVYFSD